MPPRSLKIYRLIQVGILRCSTSQLVVVICNIVHTVERLSTSTESTSKTPPSHEINLSYSIRVVGVDAFCYSQQIA